MQREESVQFLDRSQNFLPSIHFSQINRFFFFFSFHEVRVILVERFSFSFTWISLAFLFPFLQPLDHCRLFLNFPAARAIGIDRSIKQCVEIFFFSPFQSSFSFEKIVESNIFRRIIYTCKKDLFLFLSLLFKKRLIKFNSIIFQTNSQNLFNK